MSYCAVQFAVWEALRRRLGLGMLGDLLAGAAAGAAATLASYPADTLRTRFVAQGSVRKYASLRGAILAIPREEGVRGFYRGLSATLAQIVPFCAAQFFFYSTLQRVRVWQCGGLRPVRPWETATIGCIAGVGARLCILPVELVKRRLQVQGMEDARKAFGRCA